MMSRLIATPQLFFSHIYLKREASRRGTAADLMRLNARFWAFPCSISFSSSFMMRVIVVWLTIRSRRNFSFAHTSRATCVRFSPVRPRRMYSSYIFAFGVTWEYSWIGIFDCECVRVEPYRSSTKPRWSTLGVKELGVSGFWNFEKYALIWYYMPSRTSIKTTHRNKGKENIVKGIFIIYDTSEAKHLLSNRPRVRSQAWRKTTRKSCRTWKSFMFLVLESICS